MYDPTVRDTINGITHSNKLDDMVLSEAILLVNRTRTTAPTSSPNDDDKKDGNNTYGHVLRRLFLARLVESKLLSYEQSGYADIPSIPKRPTTRHLHKKQRLPSAPGGPIILCLDTSWSMSTGNRESISKAVVLACVVEAHKQGRSCQVVAFSSQNNIIETGILTPTANDGGLPKLLDFLSNSFGGGTDVSGALKYLIEQYKYDKKEEMSLNSK